MSRHTRPARRYTTRQNRRKRTPQSIASPVACALGAILLALASFPPAAYSQTTNWTGTTGDWFNASNWSAGIPSTSTDANIDNGGTAQVSADGAVVHNLTIGNSASGSVSETNGSMNSFGITLGQSAQGAGLYALAGGTLNWESGPMFVGYSGQGSFTQSGGDIAAFAPMITIGSQFHSSGTYTYSAGACAPMQLTVGDAGAGTFTQNSGAVSFSGLAIYLGASASGTGTYNLNSGNLDFLDMSIGDLGVGSFIVNGGDANANDKDVVLGAQAGSAGTLKVTDGTLEKVHFLAVGGQGAGMVEQSGGTIAGMSLSLPQLGSAPASYLLSGGSATFSSTASIGATGHFLQTGGSFTVPSETIDSFAAGGLEIRGGTHSVNFQLQNLDQGLLIYAGGNLTARSFKNFGTLQFDLDPTKVLQPISVTDVELGGELAIDLQDSTTNPIDGAGSLTLLAASETLSGQFDNVANGQRLSTPNGSFLVSYGPGSPFGADNLVISDFQPAPEPSGFAFVILGSLIVLRRGRRSRPRAVPIHAVRSCS